MTIDPTKHSFSVAYGYKQLPPQLRLGDLPEAARMGFWNVFYTTYIAHKELSLGINFGGRYFGWEKVLASAHADHFNQGLDTFNTNEVTIFGFYKSYFLTSQFIDVFDLILYLTRHEECPSEFIEDVANIFVKHGLAYVFDVSSRTILPASTPEEGQSIVDALGTLQEHGLNGARNHLIQSATFINQGEWARSVHESISAVESVARQIAPGSKTLGDALKQLRKQGLLEHRALEQGLGNLYGYTSDEQGVRHSLLDQGASNVGQDEAVFMLGACASFSSYLWRKGLGVGV